MCETLEFLELLGGKNSKNSKNSKDSKVLEFLEFLPPDDPDATRDDWSGVTLESYARSAAEVAQLHAYLRQRGRIQTAPKGKRKP